MSFTGWKAHVEELNRVLSGLYTTGQAGRALDADDAFLRWQAMTVRLRNNRGTIFLVGNGASASMASHMAADLAKNGQLHTEVFSDLSLVTAISNDMGYDHVFSEPLSRRCRKGDMLVAISSSGRSPNVLKAADLARRRGLNVITLSAMKPGNPLRGKGMLNFYVPASTYGYAESCHAAILHHWMDMVEVGKRKAERGK
ncbi:MAG: hypothetical protein A2498_11005 [Lentisphaerae bacterium RIFOXYC12_FULL_60_16]|nr:MAG: hypothetical protein A2498_11005 [Lentisphaerae bacterium RIFOXYC12_FULL_60_16]OGV76204.1 MAG: hypothetical protein A2340_00080 [Lentisphaerae bacterium RIFOXYB12_FULL_60_10]